MRQEMPLIAVISFCLLGGLGGCFTSRQSAGTISPSPTPLASTELTPTATPASTVTPATSTPTPNASLSIVKIDSQLASPTRQSQCFKDVSLLPANVNSAGLKNNPLTPFDFFPRTIVSNAQTVRFLAKNYNFVFCRRDRTWSVQPATGPTRPSYTDDPRLSSYHFINRTTDPAYETLQYQGRLYRYRVIIVPSRSLPQKQSSGDPRLQEKAVFELMAPGQSRSQRYTR
jgi:hypothetical protein